jgi:hypothetical protein
VSEQAPERATRPGQPAKPGGRQAKGKENAFTRKIGPLPMWVWLAIIAAVIVLWAMWSGKKSSTTSSGGGGGGPRRGYGASLVPPVVIHTFSRRRGRGDNDEGEDRDRNKDRDEDEDERERRRKGRHGRGRDRDDRNKDRDEDEDERERSAHPMVRSRAHVRGRPVPGELVHFKTNSRGTPPSLQQVADGLNTSPDSIIQESTGRGIPHGAPWTRYVQQGDYARPLPNGVDMAILARPKG